MPNLLKARGLITYRSELNVPDGAMDVADNIVIDEDDVVELRRGQGDFGDDLPLLDDRVKQVAEYKTLLLRHYNSTLQFDNGSGTFSDFSGSYQELEDGLRIKYLEANGNFYFTDVTGIKKISARTSSQVTANSIEDAGVPRAVSLEAAVKYEIGGFLPPQSKVAYRVLWGKKDNNNNLLLGYPSERFVLTNTSDTINVNESFEIQVKAVPTIDDVITFGNDNDSYFLWFDKHGTEDAPETSQTLGRTGIEVTILSGSATTADAASKIANAIATIPDYSVSVSGDVITVTANSPGNIEDPKSYISGVEDPQPPGVTFAIKMLEQGSITEGDSANATLNFTVPAGINSSYFYQVYRTSAVTVPTGFTLDDIDPGDEMNLVYEGNPLDDDGALLTEVTVEDITPEDFRASADFLYTNPISGEGILQANAKPPVAKDITLFNGSNFYANTKTTHKQTVNLVSVINMTSGTSDFIIGNQDVTRRYTAIGVTQVQDVTITSNTVNEKAFLLESARDERQYFVWYDEDGEGVKPSGAEFENKIAVRVRYDSTGETTTTLAEKTASALATTGDFSVDVTGSVMTITHAKNGIVTLPVRDSSSAATGFTFAAVTTSGDGEDLVNQQFLLSSLVSVAASIDETARSLVKVINADSQAPVNAYYLSGADDVPGIILLEARDLEDKAFYIGTSDEKVQEDFDPSLSLQNLIVSTTASGSSTDVVLSDDRNIFVGQELFFYDVAGNLPFANGVYEVNSVIPGAGSEVTVNISAESIGNSASVGAAFVANNVSDNEESLNRLYFSKSFQPESVPLVNFIDIGPRDKAILRVLPLRDNLFALKEDGVYIISGSSAPNFTVRLLDSSVSILAADSAVVLNNSIYALSDDGVVRISDTGVEVISRPIENLIKDVVNSRFDFEKLSFGVSYSSDRSYLLWLPTLVSDTVATQCYRYNNFTRTWTRFTIPATCGLVASRDDKMYLGAGDRNSLTQERKNGNRTDYADEDFDLQILPNSVNGTTLRVSTANQLREGDVLYQEQYVTISKLKALLRKLDIDANVKAPTPTGSIDAATEVDGIADTITILNHGIATGREVRVQLEAGVLPAGLRNNQVYKVISVGTDTIKLSVDGTTPIDLEPSIGSFILQILPLGYEETIIVEAGIKVSSILDAIVDKLIEDGVPVTDIVTSDDLETQRDQYNNLIDELNNSGSGTSFKNYKKAEDLVSYEMVIESVTTLNNSLTLFFETPFVEGDVTVFKGIQAKFQYAPQHFGDPSVLKQVRQGTIIFDQNSFYGGVIAYASDQSADFVDTSFSGYGPGDWGTGIWGDGTWGGLGNDIPHRTLIPLEKQRCRYLTVQIRHTFAREVIRINGISLMVRPLGNRAYR